MVNDLRFSLNSADSYVATTAPARNLLHGREKLMKHRKFYKILKFNWRCNLRRLHNNATRISDRRGEDQIHELAAESIQRPHPLRQNDVFQGRSEIVLQRVSNGKQNWHPLPSTLTCRHAAALIVPARRGVYYQQPDSTIKNLTSSDQGLAQAAVNFASERNPSLSFVAPFASVA